VQELDYLSAFKQAIEYELTGFQLDLPPRPLKEVIHRLSVFGLKVPTRFPFSSQNNSLAMARTTKLAQPALIPQLECVTTVIVAKQTSTVFEQILHKEERPLFSRDLLHQNIAQALAKA
jgi:hypothetical protein